MADQEVKPSPEAVVHALLDEITQSQSTRPGGGSNRVHWLTVAVTTLLGVGTLVGILGKAFYVERSEYTVSEAANAISHTKITETLASVDRTLQAQTQALNEMSKALQAQAVEMAALKHSR